MDATGGGAVVAGGGLDDADAAFFSRRGHRCCGCFWAPRWASSSPSPSPRARRAEPEPGATADEEWWHRVGASSSGRRRWWRRGVDALMEVRVWSELVAGPRWKTFIRRFRRGIPRYGGGGKLNYDPLSYALNFDEGHAGGGGSPQGGDYAAYPDFSSRFVAPLPASAKTSMDIGSRDAPPLFLHHHHNQAHSPPQAAARG